MSPAQRSVMDQVVQWSRNWKQAGKKLRREYMLSGSEESPIIHEGIAAKASLDVRSYDARLPDHPDNKVSRATRNIATQMEEVARGAEHDTQSARHSAAEAVQVGVLADKLKALDLLGRHLGMFNGVSGDASDQLAEARKILGGVDSAID